MKKTSAIFFAIGALVVGVAGGYFWGYAHGIVTLPTSYAPTNSAAINTLVPSAPTSTLSLSGRVKSINGSVITMDANSLTPGSPLAAGGFSVSRAVTVTSDTKIIKEVPTDPAVFQQEMQAYTKRASSASTSTTSTVPVPPPLPFTETSIALSDIHVGDMIAVTASSNIISAASFTATTVQDETQL
jgi:hypothetical protein